MRAALAAAALVAMVLTATGCQAEPTPTARPSSTPLPTATQSPLPAPVTAYRPLIQAYGHCQGRFSGPEATERMKSIRDGLERGQVTPAEVGERTREQCPTPTPRPTPRPTAAPTVPAPPVARTSQEGPAIISGQDAAPEAEEEEPSEETMLTLEKIRALSPEAAEALGKMPFLKTQDREDTTALTALLHIGSWDTQVLNALTARLNATGGLADRDTIAVALAYQKYVTGLTLPEDLYRPDNLQAYGIGARLPVGGVKLFTAATAEATGHEGLAEASAQGAGRLENWHNLALQMTHVITEVANELPQGAKGMNNGLTITLATDPQGLDQTLIRQLARYWWNGNQPWLDEGMTSLLSKELSGEPPRTEVSTCAPGTTLTWLELREAEGRALPEPCTTDIGEAYLNTLREETGDSVFRSKMSTLLAQKRQLESQAGYRPPKAGLAQLQIAFEGHREALETAESKWNSEGRP